MKLRGILRLGAGAALLAAACGGGEAGGGSATTRDSAGISIVENSGPTWEAGKGWQVVDSPLVDIGGRGTEPAYELDQVRGPIRLSDGRIALFNATSNELRLYDAAGKHLRSAGRTGSGPGEFQQILGIWLGAGDSLLVGELLARRLSLLDRDGNFGRSFFLGGQGGQMVPVNGKVEVVVPLGVFGDGSLAGVSQSFAINQPRSGIYRDSITVIRYGADGSLLDTLARLPGLEMEQMTVNIGPQSMSAPTGVPLGKQSVTTAGGDRLIVAQNNAWEIEFRGMDGSLRKLVRAPVKPARITPSDIAAHRKETLDAMMANRQIQSIPAGMKEQILKQMTARVNEAKYPEHFAFFAQLLTDAEGNLWAQEVTSPVVKTQRFIVVDSTGRWLGVVSMPAEFRPSFIGREAIYGVWKDIDEVEHVRAYRLRKP